MSDADIRLEMLPVIERAQLALKHGLPEECILALRSALALGEEWQRRENMRRMSKRSRPPRRP